MRKLVCVYCGKQYIVSKKCKADEYDYECPPCWSERKKRAFGKKPKAHNVGERLVNYTTTGRGCEA